MYGEIAFVQTTLFVSGLFLLLSMSGFPTFGSDWRMPVFFSLAGAAWGLHSLRRLWRSDDTRDFLRSRRLLPFLLGAVAVSFVVGSAIVFWSLALVGFKRADLASVDDYATFGFATVILSLVLGFMLGLFEAVWRTRRESP